MQLTTSTALLSGVLAASPAFADFMVFIGGENSGFESTQYSEMFLFNNPPDCDDYLNAVPFAGQSDVSSNSGFVCDGCDADKNFADWEIKRLEIHDSNGNQIDNPNHITMYADEENGGWGVYDTDNNNLGSCSAPDGDKQLLDCSDGLSAYQGLNFMNCETSVTLKDSPN